MSDKLKGRMARCTYGHGKEVPSDKGLPFFEFNGEGSKSAETCKCGYYKEAHEKPFNEHICNNYTPRGDIGHDGYYCGCYGWE